MAKITSHKKFLFWMIVFMSVCTACQPVGPAPTALSTTTSPVLNPTAGSTPGVSTRLAPTATASLTARPTATLPRISTVASQPPTVAQWTNFALPGQVTLDYPAGWTILRWGDDRVDFRPADGGELAPDFTVSLEVYQRPLADRAIADPHTWEPNEGGYQVHWEKPIAVDGAEGLEFVWGLIHDVEWETQPALMAVLYSEEYELDVKLAAYLDDESIQVAQTQGLGETIATRFAYFEHMVRSVRLGG